jgi:hypothetical protein
MEAVRQIVDGNLLGSVIALPKAFRDIRVEVTVRPVFEEKGMPAITRSALRAMLDDSVTQSISGVLPHTDMALEDFRAERLRRYECAD